MPVLKVKVDGAWEEVGGISGHTHTTGDITNFPTSLPANGGDADTIDGQHASEFASASEVSDLQSKVGDTTVSDQISSAVANKLDKSGGTITGDIIFSSGNHFRVNNGSAIDFTNNSDGGVSIYQESADDSNPKLSFYGINGDEQVILNNIKTPTKNYHAANKQYVDESVASLSTKPGRIVAGETFEYPSGTTVTAGTGAEIFNDLSTREYGDVDESDVMCGNIATGNYSHAEGNRTTATGSCSHAEGCNTIATGNYSHAEGYITTASGHYSFAHGIYLTADRNQFVVGRFNSSAAGPTSNTATTGSLFIIGKGTSSSALSNAFRVTTAGAVYGASAYNSSGADYAEYFEWQDGNLNNEDRRGLFVTLDGDKIRLANADDTYILGIVSAFPAIIGDANDDQWHGMYLTDVYGAPVIQEVVNEDGTIEQQLVLNPEYNSEEQYVPRSERKEWSVVGMLGKIVVVDDGTCQVNSYCKVSNNGIGTASDIGYRVIARIDETHVKVLFR